MVRRVASQPLSSPLEDPSRFESATGLQVASLAALSSTLGFTAALGANERGSGLLGALHPSAETANLCALGRLAQLGEHQLDKLGVTGSSPVPPTKKSPANAGFFFV